MESMLSLLLIGAIYSVVYVVKSLRTPADKGGAPVFGESFPTIEVLGPERPDAAAVPQPPVAERHAAPAKPRTRANEPSLRVVAPVMQEEKQEKRGRLAKISNRSEAKRAFLYSEIFNRKY